MFRYIDQQADLLPLYHRISLQERIALDTEFIKVNTLWPKLGLIQLNVGGDIYLLDGKTLDLTDLWPLLFYVKELIFHACSEDVDLIYYYAKHKPLTNIFDTQIALSFLGYGLQISYQQAVQRLLNVHLDKGQTRSDWLARPLQPEQLSYAADDVIYLSKLAHHIKVELEQRSLLGFVEEDCRNLAKDIAKSTPTDQLYLEAAHFKYSPKQLMQLKQLCIWRAELCKLKNIPYGFVAKNNILQLLLEKQPRNLQQLAQIKEFKPQVIREYGHTILDLLHQLPVASEWPERIARPLRQQPAQLIAEINGLIQKVSDQYQIPADVLMRKRWLNALFEYAMHPQDHRLPRYLLGWRYQCLTQPILDVLYNDQQRRDVYTV